MWRGLSGISVVFTMSKYLAQRVLPLGKTPGCMELDVSAWLVPSFFQLLPHKSLSSAGS